MLAFVGTMAMVSPPAVAQIQVGGGKTAFPFEDLSEGGGQRNGQPYTSFYLFAENTTKETFKDFELELKDCEGNAKFTRIKVYPRFNVDENGAPDPGETDTRADWDVDDNMDRRANEHLGMAADPNSTRPPDAAGAPLLSNETDNVDDSPGTKTRVDASGRADPVECCGGESGAADATQRGTEDDERQLGDPNPGNEYLSGQGGVKAGGTVALEIEFTERPAGKNCRIELQPSGVGARPIGN